jgi:hypothetical protein
MYETNQNLRNKKVQNNDDVVIAALFSKAYIAQINTMSTEKTVEAWGCDVPFKRHRNKCVKQ